MIKAINVANYIVHYCAKIDAPVTNLKLQKLLYYVVAEYYQTYDERLFSNEIEKWQYGPVVSEIYHEFKNFGDQKILEPKSTFIFNTNGNGDFSFEHLNFDVENFRTEHSNVCEIIERISNRYKNTSPFELVEKTHSENAWFALKDRILRGERNLFYSDNEIRQAVTTS